MRIILQIFPVVLFALSSAFAAEEEDRCPLCPPRLCTKCAEFAASCGPECRVTPDVSPLVCNDVGIFITAEFLYWTVRQDNLAFATTGEMTSGTRTPASEKGRTFYPNRRMSPGFRVGLGLLFSHDGWDVYGAYTWHRTRKTKRSVVPTGKKTLFEGAYLIAAEGRELTEMSGKWDHDFNVLDLEFGRNFYISCYLKLRPFVGLKGTWQDQDMEVRSLEINPAISPIPNTAGTGEYDLQYWGIGPRIGLDTSWQFFRCFSLIGEVAATALWGRFESKSFVYEENTTMNLFNVFENLEAKFHSINPVLEFLLGLRLESWFCCDKYHVALDAGWEVQWWGGQNQFLASQGQTKWGDLNIQGLTIKLRLDF